MTSLTVAFVLLTGWLLFLTLQVLKYRKAIIRLQEHVAWMLDYLTTPKAGDKIPRIVPRGRA